MISIRKYKIGDAAQILMQVDEKTFKDLSLISDGNAAFFVHEAINKANLIFTFLENNNNPVGIVGIIKNNSNECYIWSLFSQMAPQNSLSFVRNCIEVIYYLKSKFNKITTSIDISYPKTLKLMHFLGFKEINNLSMYGRNAIWMELNNV